MSARPLRSSANLLEGDCCMHLKVYVPKSVEIPSEYLVAITERANNSIGETAKATPATRGHLVRQAVRDGLLREFDELIDADGKVDIYCDPSSELPLEIDSRTVTLGELLTTMHSRRSAATPRNDDFGMLDSNGRSTVTP